MNFCVQNTKHNQEITYKNFLQEVASFSDIRSPELKWIKFWWIAVARESMNTKGPKQNSPARFSGDFNKHKQDKNVAGAEGK